MKTNVTKEVFVAQVQNEIERREELLKYREEIFLPTLKKFDGKVYNKRFITALQEGANERMWVKSLEYDHIEVQNRRDKYSYTDCEFIYFMVKLNDGRIDYDASTNNAIGIAWIDNFVKYTDELRDAINNYDAHWDSAMRLANEIAKYADVPHRFRETIHFYRKHLIQ